MSGENLKDKKAVFVIAFRDFRDPEYFVVKEILEKKKIEITTASNQLGTAIGADGGEAKVDILVSDVDPNNFDVVIFAGGPGALKALDNEDSYNLIRETLYNNKILAAICISPVILAKSGVLKNKKATVWSSPLDKSPVRILEENGACYEEKLVVKAGSIITGNGPNASRAFGEAIVQALESK